MSLTFRLDPVVDEALRNDLVELWAEVSNAGREVGFVPAVTVDHIRPGLEQYLAELAEGRTRLLAGFDEDGAVAATAFLTFTRHHLMKHWISLYTVMVHPKHQGKGYGRELLAAVTDAARSFEGIEAIRLTCRGGLGLEHFYASCGYKEVGRVPAAIRVAPGDDRDDITMLKPLH